jgi:hypothetical protein
MIADMANSALKNPELGLSWVRTTFVRRNFNAVRANRACGKLAELPGAPMVCFINHPGWWDPMTGVLMTDLLFPERHRFAAPMDAEALKSYPILERLGFFAVERERPPARRIFCGPAASC